MRNGRTTVGDSEWQAGREGGCAPILHRHAQREPAPVLPDCAGGQHRRQRGVNLYQELGESRCRGCDARRRGHTEKCIGQEEQRFHRGATGGLSCRLALFLLKPCMTQIYLQF